MADRRSLGEALLTPDKLAFIQSGLPAKVPATQSVPKIAAEPEVSDEEETAEIPDETVKRTRSRSRGSRRSRAVEPSDPSDLLGLTNVLVPLTTRLRPKTAAALKRAGLEQRLRGQEPATVQEIAEEAITEWLREAGYLASDAR